MKTNMVTSKPLNGSFDDIASNFDDLFDNVNRLTDLEGDALDSIFRSQGVSSVLDCACGTGIQSIGLARRGYKVAGSDISPRILRQFKEKVHSEGLPIEIKQADFRDLKPWVGRKFDAVISCGNSLPLVKSDLDVTRSLSGMIKCLRSPGMGIIGMHNYKKLEENKDYLFVRRLIIQKTNVELLFDIRLFEKKRVQVTNFFIKKTGVQWRLKTYTKSYMLITPDDLKRRMLEVGFHTVRLLDISGQRAYNNDEWVLAVGSI
jgi:glycine/sarcosine N-methyltransferase